MIETVPNNNGSHYNLAISSLVYHTLDEINNLHTMCIVCVFSVFSLYFENTEFVISKESQGRHIAGENYTCCIFFFKAFMLKIQILFLLIPYEHKTHTLFNTLGLPSWPC